MAKKYKKKEYLLIGTRLGHYYAINEKGEIMQLARFRAGEKFSGQWVIFGFSKHHMVNYPTKSLDDAWYDPKSIKKHFVWDVDHGTTRRWNDKVTDVWIEKE